jgi:uncharacterized Tic20 family protein
MSVLSDPSPMRTMVARWRSTVEGRVRDTMATDVDRVVCVLMHLWPILFPALGPFCLLVPLVLWFPFRSRSPLIDDHGREALNAILTLALFLGLVFGIIILLENMSLTGSDHPNANQDLSIT